MANADKLRLIRAVKKRDDRSQRKDTLVRWLNYIDSLFESKSEMK